MRLHRLEITAFGPFATTVEVDVDALSSAGLFLLTGATGAGKTSVLDAVCFALYGQVPGDRAGAKHLRSDHAAAGVAPEVVLDLSVGDRELRFTRSPAWSRPKLRGHGETKVQAHVLVEERHHDGWRVLTNRLDDAGLLVSELLGMSCTQFTQVALLPQGRFQTFLRASSAERHQVLQQLFRTDRFERVEQWLVEARIASRRDAEAHAATVGEVLNRIVEASNTEPPLWAEELADAVDRGGLTTWLEQVRADARDDAAQADQRFAVAQASARSAEADLHTARQRHALLQRAAVAEADLEDLQAREAERLQQTALISAHLRALPLTPLVRERSRAERIERQAADAWRTAAEQIPELSPTAPRDDLEARRRAVHEALALTRAFAPRDRAGADQAARRHDLRVRLQQVEAGVAELDHALADLPGSISDAVAAVHEARAAAARLPMVATVADRSRELLADFRRHDAVRHEVALAREELLVARGRAADAKEAYLDLREARISGMAAELAGQLVSGCSCPVCGSAEHPAPAVEVGGGVGRPEEDAARKLHEDAEFEVQARLVGLTGLENELAALVGRIGDRQRAVVQAEYDAAQTEIERLEPLASAIDVLVAEEQGARARLAAAQTERSGLLLDRAALSAEASSLEASLAGVEEERRAVLDAPGAAPGEDPDATVEELLAARTRWADTLAATIAAHDQWCSAVDLAAGAAAALTAAAHDAGFETPLAAEAAILPVATAAEVQAVLDEDDLTRRVAELTLADPEVAAARASGAVDLAGLTAVHEAAGAEARAATSVRDASRARRDRLDTLAGLLTTRVASWAPLRRRHREIAELAALVEGKSVDNPHRMRLAAYVLAERLRQVVAAANERLAGMTDHRYALQHTDERGSGEQRGGLSLLVRDDWNGVLRDPATLSGGETFVVSLALALGLADTVAHEAGGTDIDTLFIDEGFGSLDADTLEDVMDTLDGLRDGGRVVGLVSHVAELRSRIVNQLEVTKARDGSTLRTVLSPG